MTEPDEEGNEPGTEPTGGKPEPDWKAEARKWETRAKENSAAAKKLAEIEEAKKTEEQKATEARAAVEKERDEARAEVLRMRVAAAKGLPAELAARLRGATEDELAKDADELLKLVKPPTQPNRPVPDLRSGALPGGDRQPANPGSAMDDQIRAALKSRADRRIT